MEPSGGGCSSAGFCAELIQQVTPHRGSKGDGYDCEEEFLRVLAALEVWRRDGGATCIFIAVFVFHTPIKLNLRALHSAIMFYLLQERLSCV